MDLINANHGDLPAKLTEVFHKEALWSDEKNFNIFILNLLDDGFFRRMRLLGVEGGTWDEVVKLLQLISHERD